MLWRERGREISLISESFKVLFGHLKWDVWQRTNKDGRAGSYQLLFLQA